MPSSGFTGWSGGDPRTIAHGLAGGIVAADGTRLSVWQFTAGDFGCEFHFEVSAPTSATNIGYRFGAAVTLITPAAATITSGSTTVTISSGVSLSGGLFASGGVLATDGAFVSAPTTSTTPWVGLWVDPNRCVTIWCQTVNRALAIQTRIREYKFGGGSSWTRYA